MKLALQLVVVAALLTLFAITSFTWAVVSDRRAFHRRVAAGECVNTGTMRYGNEALMRYQTQRLYRCRGVEVWRPDDY